VKSPLLQYQSEFNNYNISTPSYRSDSFSTTIISLSHYNSQDLHKEYYFGFSDTSAMMINAVMLEIDVYL
jgi:hypothetical protein